MHPIGIALAFLVFWSLFAVGTYLIALGYRGARVACSGFWTICNACQMFLGLVLMLAGLYATFVVLIG